MKRSMQQPTLVGLYFIRERGEGSYCTGQITRQVAPDGYLVQFDRVKCSVCDDDSGPPLPLELFTMTDLSDCDEDGEQCFKFFDTEAERQTWIDWINAPSHKDESEAATEAKARRH